MYKVVLFDLDDTLYLEKDYVFSGYKVISKFIENRFGILKEEAYSKMLELSKISYNNIFNRLFEEYKININSRDIKEMIELFKNHKPNIKLCEDSLIVLENLKRRNIKLGLITDGDFVQQRNKIEALNLEKYFEKVIITDELGKDRKYWKPNKKAFKMMIDFFKEEASNMIYIGDNINKDQFGALEVGINFGQILRKKSIKEYEKTKYFFGENLLSLVKEDEI